MTQHIAQTQIGDVVVSTRKKQYVLRVEWGLPLWLGNDCMRRAPYHLFRTASARGLMLVDMLEAPGQVGLAWVQPIPWADPVMNTHEIFRRGLVFA